MNAVKFKPIKQNHMTDICKCKGDDCPFKEYCYRFTAQQNDLRQTYFVEPPYKDGKCDYYWGDLQESILNQLEDIVNDKNTNQ